MAVSLGVRTAASPYNRPTALPTRQATPARPNRPQIVLVVDSVADALVAKVAAGEGGRLPRAAPLAATVAATNVSRLQHHFPPAALLSSRAPAFLLSACPGVAKLSSCLPAKSKPALGAAPHTALSLPFPGVAKLSVGRPEDDCDITPVVSESSANFIEGLVDDAREKGETPL
jgi:hypothetical protein